SAAPRHLHSFPTRRSSDLASPDRGAPTSACTRARQKARARTRPVQGRRTKTQAAGPHAELRSGLRDFTARTRLFAGAPLSLALGDRKSTRLNSSHVKISYA